MNKVSIRTEIGLVNCAPVADFFISYRSAEKDVSLSYAPEDDAIAAHVIDALQRSGLLVDETQDGLDSSSSSVGPLGFGVKAAIVLWSSHPDVSSKILADAERARRNDARSRYSLRMSSCLLLSPACHQPI